MSEQIHPSKTIKDKDGKILFFSLADFLKDIAKGDCCFICGAPNGSKDFNDEHVIPDWILTKFNLHSKSITLPNKTKLKYAQYKVPCCVECNSELGKIYERPLSKLLCMPYSEISAKLRCDPAVFQFLFKWVSLIFIKTHLKDRELLFDRDTRKESGKIGDQHKWEDLHHVHCIARSHYTNAIIDSQVYGTILVMPAIPDNSDDFDYMDTPFGNTVMVRIKEVCIIAVLDDSNESFHFFSEHIQKITGPLNSYQIREIVAHFNCININLKERPVYYSGLNDTGEYIISGNIPEFCTLLPEEERTITAGQCLKEYVANFIRVDNKVEILKEIEEGKRRFLFDANGEFLRNEE